MGQMLGIICQISLLDKYLINQPVANSLKHVINNNKYIRKLFLIIDDAVNVMCL